MINYNNNNNNKITQKKFELLSVKEKSKILKEVIQHDVSIEAVINDSDPSSNKNEFKNILNYINYITSFTILDQNRSIIKRKRINNERDIIFSMCLYIGDLSEDYILKHLDMDAYVRDEYLSIIYVNWEFPGEHKNLYYEMKNYKNDGYTLFVESMDYKTFFKKIDNLSIKVFNGQKIEVKPIVIFRGIHWGNICYLFKLHGFAIFGGSITKRHIISFVEYWLAKFMVLFDGFLSKKGFYDYQSDKVLTSNRYDKSLYNTIKKNIGDNIDYYKIDHKSRFINEFLEFNNIFSYELELEEIEKNIIIKKKELENITNELQSYNDGLADSNKEFERDKRYYNNLIKSESEELKKNGKFMSKQHRMNKKK